MVNVLTGLGAVVTPSALLWNLIGVVIGIVFGALPGLTATQAVAIFTPLTFVMPFTISMSFLLGIYCGGYYGGAITAILLRTPGAPGNAATCMDGYPMAQKGQAGKALAIAVMASWLGGELSALALMVGAPALSLIALRFGPPEYFAIGLLGLVCVAGISEGNILKGVAGGLAGMLLATIGMDPISGRPRFTLGIQGLMAGVALIPALVGLFAITEVLAKAEQMELGKKDQLITEYDIALPTKREWWESRWTLLKGTIIGVIVGVLPGTGPTIASWMSYQEAKRSSKHPELFGTGITEGVMATEVANNAVTGGALIPLLTLGVPGDSVTAVLLGSLMIQGLTPGPLLIRNNPALVSQLFWILIIANAFMLAIGLGAARAFPQILRIPMRILLPIICVLCIVGSYAVNNSLFDVWMVVLIGFVGFVASKFGFQVAPIVLGFILGPIIEPNFRRALITSGGSPLVFVTRPFSLGILILAGLLLAFILYRQRSGGVAGEAVKEPDMA
ncbi:MAG TPA: C4-dicarboxylate ABC transporter permease [Firmicutes bacterium]|nr:C4-dicarboxylate ABC transporter permease [Bacillota bacterium]